MFFVTLRGAISYNFYIQSWCFLLKNSLKGPIFLRNTKWLKVVTDSALLI